MKIKKILLVSLFMLFVFITVACNKTPTYTIKFVDYDETLLLTLTVEEGVLPEYTLENPSRSSTDQYSYNFIGWDKEVVVATEDLTYIATYQKVVNTYTVTFKDEDGTVLSTQTIEYGSIPTYEGKEPNKESDTQFSYRFNGWDKEISPVTNDVVYTAVYSKLTNAYEITFLDSNGTVLYQGMFDYGETPVYNGETPSLEGNVQYSYPFAGWDKEIVSVTEEAIYIATYDTVINKYKVDFVDEDGTVLQSTEVEYGKVPEFTATLPSIPKSDSQYEYSGQWDKEFSAVLGEQTYTYIVTKINKTYSVKFVNDDGELLLENDYEYGQLPTYNLDNPTKLSTVQYSYFFKGWDKEIVNVTNDVTYIATYDTVINKYKVDFVDEDGTVLQSTEVEYGKVPEFTATLPTKDATIQYSFVGSWNKEFSEVVTDTTYVYEFSSVVNQYDITINHLNLDGTIALEAYTVKLNYNEMDSYNGYYSYQAPTIENKVPNQDVIYYTVDGKNLTFNIYYSSVDVWDGTSVSTSLQGSGTEEDPYLIQSGADLAYIKAQVASGNYFANAYLKLTKSIDLNNNAMAIGTSDEVSFGGILDGNNCSIRGLKLETTTKQTALFYALKSTAKISNLALYGLVSGGASTGGFTGYNYGTITNCINYATINHSANSGAGIAGTNDKDIIGCINYGNVTGTGTRGAGITSTFNKGNVTNCINYGNITGTAGASGTAGIVGKASENADSITGCRNFGTIKAENLTGSGNATGGIAGEISTPIFTDNINYGSVGTYHTTNVKGYVGGVIGRINKTVTTITDCYNFGDVYSAKNYAGGIIGMSYIGNATVKNCHNYGKVETAYSQAGGIVGRNENASANLIVINCNNYGDVIGATHAGAIAGTCTGGKATNATFTNCDNYGTYNAPTKSHIVGQDTSFTATECDDFSVN